MTLGTDWILKKSGLFMPGRKRGGVWKTRGVCYIFIIPVEFVFHIMYTESLTVRPGMHK